ncbi:sphingosine-1-phosphate lyase 1-like [Diadema antillarum]|uniref:sphingosine-1-phosphate lyase 1-like n=1 Tax=Diadema antillarum TaxID=105358 RepID=UPI003A883304
MEDFLHTLVDNGFSAALVVAETLDHVDDVLSEWPPVQLVLITAIAVIALLSLHRWVWDSHLTLLERGKRKFFRMLRSAPYIGRKIQEELTTTKANIAKSSFKLPKGQSYQTCLPQTGMGKDELMDCIKKNYKNVEEIAWQEGKVSGTVYIGDENKELMGKVFEMFSGANLLQPGVFPGPRKMEAEIVAMCCNLFKGGPNACGTTTSGGTESLLLACLAYREYAAAKGITKPEILLPDSGHAAFEKAAHMFDMRIVHSPLEKESYRADVKALKKLISKNTCMIAISAPCFPHGIIDPVEDIAKLGIEYQIPVHIDMCMGGFLYPFLRMAGHDLPPADFSVPGVTSISADLHKYGLAPKGSSVLMYSDPKYRQGQFFVSTDWTGGIYASPTLAGSRSGAITATAWASMMLQGVQGYIRHAESVVNMRQMIEERLRKIPGLKVLGRPKMSQVCIVSEEFDIYRLGAGLTARGWQLYTVQKPAGLCLVVTDLLQQHTARQLLSDVEECTAEIMKDPLAKAEGMAAIYGMAETLPDRSLVADFVCGYLDAFYSTDNQTE